MTDAQEPHGTRSGPEEKRLQGHWLLAKLGKRVLRPGGIELTRRLVAAAEPKAGERLVEFGPGVGLTATMMLEKNPKSYVGVDHPSSEVTPELSAVLAKYPQAKLVHGDARETTLDNECADLVIGEAMLTMMSNDEKLQTMREAFRILSPGGRYAIHELGFCPDNVPAEVEADVAKALSRTIKVGARPLTMKNWKSLLEEAGFEVEWESTNPMALLDPKRIIADEGLPRALRFFKNVLTNKAARDRIRGMRAVFHKHRDNLNAVAIVARKPRS